MPYQAQIDRELPISIWWRGCQSSFGCFLCSAFFALEHSISQDSDSDDETVGFLSDTGSRSKSENSETDSDSD